MVRTPDPGRSTVARGLAEVDGPRVDDDTGAVRPVRQVLWTGFYELLGRYTRRRGADFAVMNFGYDDGRALVDAAEVERYPLQLYARAVEGVAVEGRRVADVSCGRGGGLSWVHAHRRPSVAQGLDQAPVNVALSSERFARPGLSFQAGSATAMPLPDRSVDVLLSVEASHCYGELGSFLAEAARVLADDGVLVWADFEKVGVSEARRALAARHFEARDEVDIGAHVLRALEADRARRQALVRDYTAPLFWRALDHFAGGSAEADTYRRFAERRSLYFLRHLRRPRRGAHGA